LVFGDTPKPNPPLVSLATPLYVSQGLSFISYHRPGKPMCPHGFKARCEASVAWPALFVKPERLREHELALSQGWDTRSPDER
jgi:hypothetical protein